MSSPARQRLLTHDAGIANDWSSLHSRSLSITPSSAAVASSSTADSHVSPADVAVPPSPPHARPRSFNMSYRRHLSADDPPTSVTDFAEKKSYFSVTDLVGPTWCEASWRYGILGLNVLPVHERPTEIRLPSGKVIVPDRQTAVKKQQIQDRGTEVHRKLEEEIHPERIEVRTSTEADQWALRLLRIVVGLRSLLDVGCVRELPVFGFVRGNLVMGVIDEIGRKEAAPDLFGVQAQLLADQGYLVASNGLVDAASSPEKSRPSQWGFFLTDNKTRVKPSVPALSDRKAARLQTMLYKRLFDGLCLGSLQRLRDATQQESQPFAQGTAPGPDPLAHGSPSGLDSDSAAQPLDLPRLWSSLALSNESPLSDAFRPDAQDLLQDIDAHATQSALMQSSASTATLGGMVRLLDETMLELVDSAWRGAGNESLAQSHTVQTATTALRKELSLVYWPQVKGKRAGKGSYRREAKVPSISAGAPQDALVPSDGLAAGSSELKPESGASDLEDEREVDAQLGPGTQASHSPAPPRSSDAPHQPPAAAAAADDDDGIIGRVTFRHAPGWLSAHLDSVLALWSGERPARGVSEAESWKCGGCEFRQGCEWREEKAEEKVQWAMRRREARRREAEADVGVGADVDVDVSNPALALHGTDTDVVQDANPDDAELWANFAEIRDIEDAAAAAAAAGCGGERGEAAGPPPRGKRKRQASRKDCTTTSGDTSAHARGVTPQLERPAQRGQFVKREARYGLRRRKLPANADPGDTAS